MAKYTITYDNEVKGFTSFHSYMPDHMVGLNNDFFSVKDGQLYKHNDESNPIRNNFYGVQYESVITYIINDAPSEIKVAKTINTESNKALSAVIKSYINDETNSTTESTIAQTEFVNKEGKWYGYVRRNELSGDYTAKNAYGIGVGVNAVGNTINLSNSALANISVGDVLMDENSVVLGTVVNYVEDAIEVDAPPTVTNGAFILGLKEARIEGSEIRGYNFEVELTDSSTDRTELFAASSEMFKSNPS